MLTELTSMAQGHLTISLVMGVQIGLVLLLRKAVAAKLGAIACYRLWLLPVLWLPLYWLGPLLLEMIGGLLSTNAYSATHYYAPLLQFRDFELLPFNFAEDAQQLAVDAAGGNYGWATLALLWMAGTVAVIGWQGYRWLEFSRQVNRFAWPVPARELADSAALAHFDATVPVRCLPGMRSAALFGVFKPVLLLPESFSQRYDHNQRHIILAHEAVHLRRKDNCWNLCALLLLALFWTNPLVLLAWRYYRLDQELSCDALALAHCNKEQQKRYARTLLESLTSLPASGTQPALSAWDNLRDLKERSLMVKHHLLTATRRSTMLYSLVLLAVLGGSLTITFAELANAAEPTETRITKITQLVAEGKPEAARAELTPLMQAGEAGDLSQDEYLQVLQISGSLHVKAQNYAAAREDFAAVLELPNLPQETIAAMTFAVGQSYIAMEDWPRAIEYISQYLAMPGDKGPGPLYLIAVAHYQQDQYAEAITYMERLFALPEQEFHESWYSLLDALYVETQQWERAKEVTVKMVELFDNPKHQELLDKLNAGDVENL